MHLNLNKSLILGLAAISLTATTGILTTNVSAKSYARITSNQALQTAPQNRNVTTNGTSALYTKAGTLRGARVIASKYTLQRYGTSKNQVSISELTGLLPPTGVCLLQNCVV